MSNRILIAYDGTAWYLRNIKTIVDDWGANERVYHCDKHLGGPYETLQEAVAAYETNYPTTTTRHHPLSRSCKMNKTPFVTK
jgi:hypothetical protein